MSLQTIDALVPTVDYIYVCVCAYITMFVTEFTLHVVVLCLDPFLRFPF